MYQAMPHADNVRPGNFRMSIAEFTEYLTCRLADDFDATNHGILMEFPRIELRLVHNCDEFHNVARRLEQVEQ